MFSRMRETEGAIASVPQIFETADQTIKKATMRVLLSTFIAWTTLCLIPASVLAQAPVPIGNEACKTCHVPYEGHKVNPYHSDCLACHTLEARHFAEGGRDCVKMPTADNCLACHSMAKHRRIKADLECSTCHTVH